MDKAYLEYLAKLDITTYYYKILLLLNTKPFTQAQLAKELNTLPQNIYKIIKNLESMNLIKIDRIEGRNKFFSAVTDLEKLYQDE